MTACGLCDDVHGRFAGASGADSLSAFDLTGAGSVAAFAEGQPQMIAQRLALQHRIEIAALLEDRQDMRGEIVEALRR